MGLGEECLEYFLGPFPVCIWCFQGREGGSKGKERLIDRLLSALHVQIAGLPPVRTVLVFLFTVS
jgi:hypothetical protein